MNCDEVMQRVAMARPPEDDTAIDAHLAVCPQCRIRVESAEALGGHLRNPLLWEEPSPELENRVLTALGSETDVPVPHTGRWLGIAASIAVILIAALSFSGRPDWKVELEAGPMGPEATAAVLGWNEGAGTRMILDVGGLPELEAGFYEIWMTAPDGAHVSAGSFTASGRVEVNVGVRRADFPRIWVTIEPADGDPLPTPKTVLDTPLGLS